MEDIINETFKEYAKELALQYDMLSGFSGVTKSFAKLKFIDAYCHNKKYPTYLSLAFHPTQFTTVAFKNSIYNELINIANGKSDEISMADIYEKGIESLYKNIPKINDARMPFDFPSDLAKDIINEFATNKKVFDPCFGWGGRLVGFLLSDAKLYHGIDASKNQYNGVKKMYDYYKNVLNEKKEVLLENCMIEEYSSEQKYDLILTSPPYYDYEKYIGENQSYNLYGNYNIWRDLFLKKLIIKSFDLLNDNGYLVLKISDLQYPILKDTKIIAQDVGFLISEIRKRDYSEIYKQITSSSILILYKNNL